MNQLLTRPSELKSVGQLPPSFTIHVRIVVPHSLNGQRWWPSSITNVSQVQYSFHIQFSTFLPYWVFVKAFGFFWWTGAKAFGVFSGEQVHLFNASIFELVPENNIIFSSICYTMSVTRFYRLGIWVKGSRQWFPSSPHTHPRPHFGLSF